MQYKTLLSPMDLGVLNTATDMVKVYLFIQGNEKHKCGYNLMAPYIVMYPTNRSYHFDTRFAAQGCGGGLSNTSLLFNKLGELNRDKACTVRFVPRIVADDILRQFSLVDSTISLQRLIDHSDDLRDVRFGVFAEIHETLNELATTNGLNFN
jgi:hypothetical protein